MRLSEYFEVKEPRGNESENHAGKEEVHDSPAVPDCLHHDHRRSRRRRLRIAGVARSHVHRRHATDLTRPKLTKQTNTIHDHSILFITRH